MTHLRALAAETLPEQPIQTLAWNMGVQAPGARFVRDLQDIENPVASPAGFDFEARQELAQALEGNLSALGAHVRVLDSVRRLRDKRCSVVVAGQQPGLLGGPLLCLYKALHAVRLARSLEQLWEQPVVPVFWNHADDHDIAEVHHAWIPNENHDLTRVALAGLGSGRMPISRLVLDEQTHRLGALRAALAQAWMREPHVQRAVDLFTPRTGETLASAFTRVFGELLGHLGLIVVEPDWLRPQIARGLLQVTRDNAQAALAHSTTALQSAGIEPPIDPAQSPFLYRMDERGRIGLRLGGLGFRYEGEEHGRSASELAAEIVDEPNLWSPAALSRPLVQDLIFPVAAYVGGWGELAYHCQLGELRRACGVRATPFVARVSLSILEAPVQANLQKLGLDLGAVLRQGETLDVGEAQLPQALVRLRAAGQEAAALLLAEKSALAALDPALAQNLAQTADQVLHLVDKLAAKGERVHQNSSGTGRRALRRVANSLRPRGQLQERVLSPAHFVARYGTDWIDTLFESLPAVPRHPMLLELDE